MTEKEWTYVLICIIESFAGHLKLIRPCKPTTLKYKRKKLN